MNTKLNDNLKPNKVEVLDFRNSQFIQLPEILSKFTNLKTLYLSNCRSLQNVDGLANCTKLIELDLYGCKSLRDVNGIANLPNLKKLDVTLGSIAIPYSIFKMWSRSSVELYQQRIRKSMK